MWETLETLQVPVSPSYKKKKFKYRYTVLFTCFVIKRWCCVHFMDLKQFVNEKLFWSSLNCFAAAQNINIGWFRYAYDGHSYDEKRRFLISKFLTSLDLCKRFMFIVMLNTQSCNYLLKKGLTLPLFSVKVPIALFLGEINKKFFESRQSIYHLLLLFPIAPLSLIISRK